MLKKSGFWLICVISFFPTKKVGIPMGLIISVIGIISVISVSAQEQITITTYYPSPYGVYRELRSQRMAIGANWYDNATYPWDDDGGEPEGTEIRQDAELVVEGRVGIGTTSPKFKLDVAGWIRSNKGIDLKDVNWDPAAGVIDYPDSHGAQLGVNWNVGNAELDIVSPAYDAGPIAFAFVKKSGASAPYALSNLAVILRNGNVGIGTAGPNSRLTVAGSIAGGETSTGWVLGRGAWGPDGWLRLTTTQGGATYHDLAVDNFWAAGALRYDLSEVTPVKEEDKLEPGDVVVIDKENGLKATRSTKSYDTSVYGIVSSYEQSSMVIGGIGGPEVAMNTKEHLPIALIGRVKAKASAENGAIQIGDLLITSNTPGHLMGCDDVSKCTGAVAGKALESLKSGKGIITVLVTLQ